MFGLLLVALMESQVFSRSMVSEAIVILGAQAGDLDHQNPVKGETMLVSSEEKSKLCYAFCILPVGGEKGASRPSHRIHQTPMFEAILRCHGQFTI
jgi:hypothetical protein